MSENIYLKNNLSVAVITALQALLPALLAVGLLALTAVVSSLTLDRHISMLAAGTFVLCLALMAPADKVNAFHFPRSFQLAVSIFFRWIFVLAGQFLIIIAADSVAAYLTIPFLIWAILVPFVTFLALSMLTRLKRRMVVSPKNFRSAVIAGLNEPSHELSKRLATNQDLCMRVRGYFDDRSGDRLGLAESRFPLLGKLEELPGYVRRHSIEVVFISLPMRHVKRVTKLLEDLQNTTASIYYVPDLFVYDLIQSRTSDVMGVAVVSMCESPLYGYRGIVKRASDVFLTVGVLALALPVMLACAAAVRATSQGPVIFRQRRYGLDGREFLVYKFRTMRITEDGDVIRQATQDDPRVTPVGAFLRRYSLDELPQLINVLQGRMSLVGPRPHAVAHNEEYRGQIKGYMIRHKVLPGITGLAQVNGCRGETRELEQMERRIKHDLEYLRNWTPMLDLKILALTAFRMIGDKNAY